MLQKWVPDVVSDSVEQLDIQMLYDRGIRLLMADLDNTLAPYKTLEPSPELCQWTAKLQQKWGIRLLILSNSRRPNWVEHFARSLGVPFIGHAGKPRARSFQQAMEQMGVTAGEAAMIGDQIFTDIWGGHNAGVLSILVEPIRLWGNPGRYVRYAVETPFRLVGRRKGGAR